MSQQDDFFNTSGKAVLITHINKKGPY